MKKRLIIIAIAIITVLIVLITVSNLTNSITTTAFINNFSQGMEVTMLGESNMKDKGNTNACGYIITTANNELIVVDGGNDIDKDIVLNYIKKLGNGTVDYWFVTHPHGDHVGALVELLKEDDIEIQNLCYSFNSLEWYEKYDERGFKAESKMFNSLNNPKIKNKIEVTKNQVIEIDNLKCDILRVANPEIINSDNGNDSSMVFKFTAIDVNKSIIFLGDAFKYTSIELLENPEVLKSDVVQMAHHGQNGVSKEVYEAINPDICCFNIPEWLYNNDNGNGYNSGSWQSIEVRSWVQELGAKSVLAFEGDQTLQFTSTGIFLKELN